MDEWGLDMKVGGVERQTEEEGRKRDGRSGRQGWGRALERRIVIDCGFWLCCFQSYKVTKYHKFENILQVC